MPNLPEEPLSDSEIKNVVRSITDRFLRFGKGTPKHEAKAKLGGKRSALDELVNRRYLQSIKASYFPTLLSIEIENKDTREHCEKCTTVVLNTLKVLYTERGKVDFSRSDLLLGAEKVYGHADPEVITTGMLFATDFSAFRSHWDGNEQEVVTMIYGVEGILDFDNFRSAWKDEQGKRNFWGIGTQLQYEPPANSKVTSETTDTTGRNVFVIHGRNARIRDSMFTLLRTLGLNPMEWGEILSKTGNASPYVGEVLDKGFSLAAAVVAVLTPDDLACLHPDFVKDDDTDDEKQPTGQARPNVLFETGMALARHPSRTILVEIGKLRPFSDVGGRYLVKFDGSAAARNTLAERLRTAGCQVNTTGQDWLTAGDFQIDLTVQPKRFGSARPGQPSGWFEKVASVECIEIRQHDVDEPTSSDRYFKMVIRDRPSRTTKFSDFAILAAFRISTDSPSNYAKLTARIDFLDVEGKIVQRVDCGVWIAKRSHEISINKSDTLYLLLALRDRSKGEWLAVDNNPVQFGFIKKSLPARVKARVTLLIDDQPTTYPETNIPRPV
jgi:predicted nucleotide-binding protein